MLRIRMSREGNEDLRGRMAATPPGEDFVGEHNDRGAFMCGEITEEYFDLHGADEFTLCASRRAYIGAYRVRVPSNGNGNVVMVEGEGGEQHAVNVCREFFTPHLLAEFGEGRVGYVWLELPDHLAEFDEED